MIALMRLHVAESEITFNVQASPEGGYEANALGSSIFTQADTLDEMKTMLQDSMRCHFEPLAFASLSTGPTPDC